MGRFVPTSWREVRRALGLEETRWEFRRRVEELCSLAARCQYFAAIYLRGWEWVRRSNGWIGAIEEGGGRILCFYSCFQICILLR